MPPDVICSAPRPSRDDATWLGNWRNTGEVVADAAELGYCAEPVIDCTYSKGTFWKVHRPEVLATNDINPAVGADMDHDFRKRWPAKLRGTFATVAYDPDYKLSGKVTDWGTNGERFGTQVHKPVPERIADIYTGLVSCSELCRVGGHLWHKTMNQVSLDEEHWLMFDAYEIMLGRDRQYRPYGQWEQAALLMLPGTPRSQVSQKRPRNNYSVLQIFRRFA